MKIKEIVFEAKRIPRKKGQKANSKKHSDLYTDENPKGTIHVLVLKMKQSQDLCCKNTKLKKLHIKYRPSSNGAKSKGGRQGRPHLI